MRSVKVSDLMTDNVVTVRTDDLLRIAKEHFDGEHHRHILVTEGKQLKGIISLTDFLRTMHGMTLSPGVDEVRNDELLDSLTIAQVMTENPVSLKPEDSLKKAAELFQMNMFHAIPVVEKGELKGIITTVDLIGFLFRELTEVEL